MIASGKIAAIHTGRITVLPGAGRRGAGLDTAYRKSPVAGPVAIHPLGLHGDEQANGKYHGGPDKAVYAYAAGNYPAWATEFPDIADRFVPGSMGENLVVTGLDETTVHLGDIVRIGTALLQVSQIREPCSTMAAIFGTAKVVRTMTRSGRCGWYFRVLEAGTASAGDAHAIVDRPNPDWPISRFTPFAAGKSGNREALEQLATLPGLVDYWRLKAAAALAAQRAWPATPSPPARQ